MGGQVFALCESFSKYVRKNNLILYVNCDEANTVDFPEFSYSYSYLCIFFPFKFMRRRPNAVPNGPQASQLRSQPSEQSFSQGFSSQHGMFSQLSQNSLSDVLTNDQVKSRLRFEPSVGKESLSCVFIVLF